MPNNSKSNSGYRFGEFVLDVDRGRLLRGDAEIKVRPKSFEVLHYLVEHAGKLVSRQELLDAVWNGAVVTDDAVTQCLIDIRKGLDDSTQKIIKTVPRRGYIFELPVESLVHADPGSFARTSSQRRRLLWVGVTVLLLGLYFALVHTPSESIDRSMLANEDAGTAIAILPLVNMSSDEENAFFTGGIHEEILTRLSRIEDFDVISRSAMLRYAASEMTLREISDELGVHYIVEGSVRRIDDHVRVTVQLTNARNDMHLWANNYERELADIFATQSELAREITDSILLELKPESIRSRDGMPTNSVKAYDLFIRADSIEKAEGETEDSMLRRREMLEEAVAEDPDFAEAWAVLKRLYDLQRDRVAIRGWYVEEGDDRNAIVNDLVARSQRALAKAISLDPQNVETLLSTLVDHDWPKTAEEMQAQKALFDQLISTHPKHAKTWYHLGWWHAHRDDLSGYDMAAIEADSVAAFEEALRLDPFSARIVNGALSWYRELGREDDIVRLSNRLNQIVPETAADRRLARVSWSFRHQQILEAFVDTADQSLIQEYERGWTDAGEINDFGITQSQHWFEMVLRILSDDEERLVDLARIPIDLDENKWQPLIFSNIQVTAMNVYSANGELEQAQRVARNILQHQAEISTPDVNHVDSNLFSLAQAHAIVGNNDEARHLAEQLVAEKISHLPLGVLAMAPVDVERSVEIAFAHLAENPNWDGFDWAAVFHIWSRPFLADPRVQEHYEKSGKWTDYLAERVPGYALQ